MTELEELRNWKKKQEEKIEVWAQQQVKYTEEIIFLMETLKDSEREILDWRNQYVESMNRATYWKKKFLKLKGINV